MILGLDFETFSDADLKQVGAWNYSRHPSTGVMLCVFGLQETMGGAVRLYRWFPGNPLPPEVEALLASDCSIVAHNASFERSVIENVADAAPLRPLLVTPERWVDTAMLARGAGLPGALEGAASVFGLAKDMQGNALTLSLATPERWAAATSDERERVAAYCEQDVVVMLRLHAALPKPTLVERCVQLWDTEVNQRGITVDLDRAAAMARMAEERKRQIEGEAFLAAGGDVMKVLTPQRLKPWLVERGVKLPTKTKDGVKTVVADKEALQNLLKEPDLDATVRRVLEFRLEHGKLTSLAKLKKLPSLVGDDGRLRHALRYCAAHTGRWASYGVQLHNLPKMQAPKAHAQTIADFLDWCVQHEALDALTLATEAPLAALSSALRSVFVAAPGYDLIGGDFAAIEARGIAWAAGQDDVLALFASGQDVYVADAAAVGSDNRQLGKVLRLGLGYQMGPLKFIVTAAKSGIVLSRKEAARLVRAWREANPMIVAWWNNLNEAAISAVQAPGRAFRAGPVTFAVHGPCLGMRLPSGRVMRFWRPEVVVAKKSIETIDEEGNIKKVTVEGPELRFFVVDDTGNMVREHTYGGKLAENAIQAVCRDLLAEAGLRCRGTIYTPVLHVHDSLVTEVPEGAGDLRAFAALMARAPAWAAGFPIAVDPYRGKRFKG